jgi:hypothetical protein
LFPEAEGGAAIRQSRRQERSDMATSQNQSKEIAALPSIARNDNVKKSIVFVLDAARPLFNDVCDHRIKTDVAFFSEITIEKDGDNDKG